MRISKTLAATVSDIDLERGVIIVSHSAKDRGRTGSTNGNRFRRVEIHPKLVAMLTALIAARAIRR